MMKYWPLILLPVSLLGAAPDVYAHDLSNINGTDKSHQHVYRRQQYGKPLQQGHHVQSPGSNNSIVWGPTNRSNYGKSTVARSGPIIGDRKRRSRVKTGGKSKYGKAVKGYGKAVNNYGKSGKAN